MDEKIRILAVDDNAMNLKVLDKMLSADGYIVDCVDSGVAALSAVGNVKYDLILLDIMMPVMDGFEVCKRLKAMPSFDVPVIFLSAKDQIDDVVEGFKLGGVDYITKPFRKEELMVRINNHVQLKLAKDVIARYAETYKESRNSVLKLFMEFGKNIHEHDLKESEKIS